MRRESYRTIWRRWHKQASPPVWKSHLKDDLAQGPLQKQASSSPKQCSVCASVLGVKYTDTWSMSGFTALFCVSLSLESLSLSSWPIISHPILEGSDPRTGIPLPDISQHVSSHLFPKSSERSLLHLPLPHSTAEHLAQSICKSVQFSTQTDLGPKGS